MIDALNKRPDVNGILVQMPLPPHINEKIIIAHINPIKDVDAFHETNVGKIMIGNFKFLPCTPAGIIHLLDESNIEISSKHCVIIGRSNIVGKPLAMLMLHRDATVTICHSKTKNLTEICKTADILIAAVGKVNFVTSNMVKPGAVVVDVGINRCENGKICGDVDFEHVKNIASYNSCTWWCWPYDDFYAHEKYYYRCINAKKINFYLFSAKEEFIWIFLKMTSVD